MLIGHICYRNILFYYMIYSSALIELCVTTKVGNFKYRYVKLKVLSRNKFEPRLPG